MGRSHTIWSRILAASVLFVTVGCTGIAEEQAVDEEQTMHCAAPGAGVSIGGDANGDFDTMATPTRRLVLMGGGAEVDTAARLFAEAAGGGDLVVLRATGSLTSYPTYFTTTLSPQPALASAVTILTSNPTSAADAAVLCRIERAEAVWLAGGNQWDYLGRWPLQLQESLSELSDRGVSVGGTSAGAVSLGEGAFDARSGGVSSAEALTDPLTSDINITYPSFAQPELHRTIVDSHFSRRDREGRLLAFLARFLTERSHQQVVGIGLDEGVALVIEGDRYRVLTERSGLAWLYEVRAPVVLSAGSPLTLAAVRALRLPNGSAGAWPIDFDSVNVEVVEVVNGVVSRGAS